jgi:hypothetical protein
MVRSAARRALSRAGREVSLSNRKKIGEDDYGPNFDETTDSPHTVTARVDRDTSAEVVRDSSGSEVRVDADIFIRDDTAAVNDGLDGGGHKGASRVDVDGETYVVIQIDRQDNGLLRLETARKD